ncbi:sugar phosphate isomerase/epimerase [Agromyces intestinalis]|uniref:Sugar phosphate isomerase/epimerase n=1 Tax=Agromyces intestinalis TaxID=2592652 RepID=A0A5C1YFG3_9MICO|nr:sugar phosphate isomerase/epimerase [Agromyces intestinalis]QEO14418.1 sugar phosphate isomerase/epimerase [Agromyces intestinalis]
MTTPTTTSIQLFTLRDQLDRSLDDTLAGVAGAGFTAVEPYDFVRRAAEFAAAFERHGLRAPTGHAFLASPSFIGPDGSPTDDATPTNDEVFEAATTLGMQIVFDPYTDPERWSTRADIEVTAERLNAAAAAAAAHGLRVGYHNHAHELDREVAGADGRLGLEVLADALDPAVLLEVDLYWAARAGTDVPALVHRLGDRVAAVHVKDGSLAPALTAEYPPADQVPAGEGNVPLRAAIAAATALEYTVVEFDAYHGGDLYAAVAASRGFLDARAAA